MLYPHLGYLCISHLSIRVFFGPRLAAYSQVSVYLHQSSGHQIATEYCDVSNIDTSIVAALNIILLKS